MIVHGHMQDTHVCNLLKYSEKIIGLQIEYFASDLSSLLTLPLTS